MSSRKEETKKEGLPDEQDQPYFAAPRPSVTEELNFDDVSRLVFKRFRAGEFEQLQKELDAYKSRPEQKDQMNEYFRQKGHTLLNWAVNTTSEFKSLVFLCTPGNFDPKTLQEILRADNFGILENFLGVQALDEAMGTSVSSEENESRIKKFQCLLAIHGGAVKEYKAKNNSQEFMTDKIRENFKAALSNPSIIPPQKAISETSAQRALSSRML